MPKYITIALQLSYLPFLVGWFITLVLTTSAGVHMIAAITPAQALK